MRTAKRASCILVFVTLLAGCFGQRIKWQEEVLLHDGGILVVKRTAKFGAGQREPGAHSIGGYQFDALQVELPDGKNIEWEAPGNLGPMTLDLIDGVLYLVTRPRVITDFYLFQCPKPAYVFFSYRGEWERIEFSELPKTIRERNLSLGFYESDSIARKKGYVTAAEVKESFGYKTTYPRYMKMIEEDRKSPCD